LSPTPDARLATLADEYWQDALRAFPTVATSIGDRRYDALLDDPSPEAIRTYRSRLAGSRRQVQAVDPSGLSEIDRVTRSALLAQIDSDDALLGSELTAWAVDPLDGPPVQAFALESFQIVATPEQAQAMVERWRALGPWLDVHAANLRRELANGRVAVRAPVDRVLDQLADVLAGPDDALPLLAPLKVAHPDWTAAERSAFEDGLRGAVRDVIRPALERYAAIVRDEIKPVARPDDRPGLVHVAGGPEAYGRLIQAHTSLPMGAEEIHAIGLDEVARIDAELSALGEPVLGTADLPTIRERLRSDPTLHFETGAEVFAKAEGALARARATIPDWFGILPQADCVVVAMAEYEEKHSTIAYYRNPAVDGSRPGQYYINTSEPQTRPRYEAETLAYHEAIPGHHLQIAIGQELTGLPEFRRHLGPTSFFEGWGLYTERLSDDMGLYSGDLDRIGILSFDAWRACRLVVDTGMHALGWTRQQAIDYMLEHTALAENNIVNEVDRYIVMPGQALAYKIGQLEMLRLRAEASAELGGRFDIRAFHDALLGQGAVGLETLRETVHAWVTGQG
jgi:uncharacterized protein (DUF885 family)